MRKIERGREEGEGSDLTAIIGREGITMALKHHLAFIPAPRWVIRSSAFEEQSEHTPSTSASTAQRPSSSASTPPTAEPLPSPISEIHAITQASECASSSWTFCGPTFIAYAWNHQHQRKYDFPDHEKLEMPD
ncbi:hypothetical protein COCNU_04G015000 [Cocos nucifera]|uniref:Uncharacterized protein n=1 Tax=Cocos nucifera TaxID=13894 RepID=A0A8K0I850_COCNU|nr:hypothetical protein COCNU_04G015000 [Cocos nucifera]